MSNVKQFPKSKTSPEAVVEFLQEVLSDVETIACVVKLKEDKTLIAASTMSSEQMTWLRFVFDEGFKPS